MIVRADARKIPLPDGSVQRCVTSPPYWGLRKYKGEQELIWGGGADCVHEFSGENVSSVREQTITGKSRTTERFYGEESRKFNGNHQKHFQTHTCIHCGAWRGAYGLAPTVEMYVAHTVEILREIRRVLRKDGVVFWNVGDSYQSGNRGTYDKNRVTNENSLQSSFQNEDDVRMAPNRLPQLGLKSKDLCLIPARVALAAQVDGWWIRSLIIWSKPNPMPESVTDRPTDSYEHIIMLTKSERYFWDAQAVKEKAGGWNGSSFTGGRDIATKENLGMGPRNETATRNLRNVWNFPTQPYSDAHFATFPEEIPRRCIKAGSRVGDLILDPFGGSGTTGRVATELNRRCMLLDLAYSEDAYAPLARKRVKEVQRQIFA